MEVWIVIEIIDYEDGNQDRYVKGVYSSYEKAVRYISDYDFKNLNKRKYYGKVVGEKPLFNGMSACSKEAYTDNEYIDHIILQVSRKPMIMDVPFC